MMRKPYTYRPSIIRFKRWSRKGYAAFSSLQKVVHIGRLAKNITERFFTKQAVLHGGLHTEESFCHTSEDERLEKERMARQTWPAGTPGPVLSVLLVRQPQTTLRPLTESESISIRESGKLSAHADSFPLFYVSYIRIPLKKQTLCSKN